MSETLLKAIWMQYSVNSLIWMAFQTESYTCAFYLFIYLHITLFLNFPWFFQNVLYLSVLHTCCSLCGSNCQTLLQWEWIMCIITSEMHVPICNSTKMTICSLKYCFYFLVFQEYKSVPSTCQVCHEVWFQYSSKLQDIFVCRGVRLRQLWQCLDMSFLDTSYTENSVVTRRLF